MTEMMERASRAVARAEFGCHHAQRLVAETRVLRGPTAWPRVFVVRGEVEGRPVRAAWCRDSLVCSNALLKRASLLVAMGEEFGDGSSGERVSASLEQPIPAMLTFMRACDHVRTIQFGPLAGGSTWLHDGYVLRTAAHWLTSRGTGDDNRSAADDPPPSPPPAGGADALYALWEAEDGALALAGEIDVSSATELKRILESADASLGTSVSSSSRGAKHTVLDLSGVTFIDSAGAGVLWDAAQSMGLDVRNASSAVRRVWKALGLGTECPS